MKPRYRCELIEFMQIRIDIWTAIVRRHEHHERLGSPTGGQTRTSAIIRIDFAKHEIETLNSVYVYAPNP